MPDYDTKFEYILDHGLECRCCALRQDCDGKVKQTPNGPVLPACVEQSYRDLLDPRRVNRVYSDHVAREAK